MEDSKRHTSVAVLAHPLAVLCVVGWAANDHIFKERFHNAVTGKLSDAFAMVVFPLLLAIIFERFSRRPMVWAIAVTAIFYSSINLFAFADRWTEAVLSSTITHSRLTQDPTDLITLPLMAGAVWLWRNRAEVQDRVPRAWGRALFVSGAIVCMATSVEDADSAPVRGTLVLDENQTQVTIPIEYTLGGEPAPANISVRLGMTAFGDGGGDEEFIPFDLVTWTNTDDSFTIQLNDLEWAPVEVAWETTGRGIQGDACVLPIPGCQDPVFAEISIDAPPDEGVEGDLTLQLPDPAEGNFQIVESVVRLHDVEAGVTVHFQDNENWLFTEQDAMRKGNRPTEIPLPPGCDEPCDVSLWSIYFRAPELNFFGDLELVETIEHVLEPVESAEETVVITADDLGERGASVEICASSDFETETMLEREINRARMTVVRSNQAAQEASNPSPSGNYRDLRQFGDSCLASFFAVYRSDDFVDGPIELTASATIYRLPGEPPIDFELISEIQSLD